MPEFHFATFKAFRTPVEQLLVAGTFLLLAALSLNLGVSQITTRPMWMPAGWVAALIFARGKRDIFGLTLGAALFGLWRYYGQHGLASLAFNALAVALQVYVGDALIKRFLTNRAQELWHGADIVLVGLILGPVVMAIKPIVVLPFLLNLGLIPDANLIDRAAEWVVADSMAVWLLGPMLLLVFGKPREWWRSRKLALGLGQGAIAVGFVLAMQYTAQFELDRLSNLMRADLKASIEGLRSRIEQLEEYGKPPERGTSGLRLVPFLLDTDSANSAPKSALTPADVMLLRLDFVPGWALDLKHWLREQSAVFKSKNIELWLRRKDDRSALKSGFNLSEDLVLSGQAYIVGMHVNAENLRQKSAPGLWWFQLTFAIAALLGTALTLLSSGQRRILEKSVQERTRSLQKASDELAVFKALADQATDPIVVLKPNVVEESDLAEHALMRPQIDYVNAAFLKVTRNDSQGFLNVLQTEQAAWRVVESLQSNNASQAEFMHLRSDGSSFWAELSAFPISIAGQKLWAGFYRDLSEHQVRIARERELERVGLERERHEQLGRMAGGLAHDFNNLMTAIQGSVELIRLETNESVSPELLESIEQAVQSGSTLTNQLLAFSGRGQGRIERVELSAKVRAMHKMLKLMVPASTVLSMKVPSHEQWVEIDSAWLSQVLVNLVVNGSHALSGSDGLVSVEVLASQLLVPPEDGLSGESLNIVSQQAIPARYVGISVKDTGCGIAPALLNRIFDPFYTTKSTGTGLGLAAVAGVVRESKGWLNVHSHSNGSRSTGGGGSEFKIFLPESFKQMSAEPARVVERSQSLRTVLVVDDEISVRAYVETVLKDQGWHVLTAESGMVAKSLMQQQDFELLITDLTMPGVTGHELIEWAIATFGEGRKVPRIVVMSGYSSNASQTRAHFAEYIVDWLNKPFSAQRLIDASRVQVEERSEVRIS
jgi:signal transduction histidine kinase/ActR/RegA family two-component response regulator